MANRYWVGGNGTWDNSTTTNWSTTPGGAGGASPPTSADSVFFDRAVAQTITCSASPTCLDLTVTNGTIRLQGSPTSLSIFGSLTLVAGCTWTNTVPCVFSATTTGNTITTNGITIQNNITFSGIGGGWTLGSAITSGAAINFAAGTFDTNGFAVTCSQFNPSFGANARSIYLRASTVTISNNSGLIWTSMSGLTFDAGTSTINISAGNPNPSITISGVTFYNVAFTSTGAGTITWPAGACTYNSLSFAGRSATGITTANISSNATIGTLILNPGANATCRTLISSNSIGTAKTFTVGAINGTAADYDFRDITITGAGAPISGARFGDFRGNTGITFPSAKNVYWNLAAGGNWSATSWATSSGGTVDVNNFPLAQDIAIIEETGLTAGSTITINAAWGIGTISMSTRTSSATISVGVLPYIFKDWINGSGTVLTGTGQLVFCGRQVQNITSAGKIFTQSFNINSPGGSVVLQDAFNTQVAAAGALSLTNGTFNLNGKTATLSASATAAVVTVAGTKNITFNDGTLVIASSGTPFNNAVPTGFSTTAGTGNGSISLTSATAKTFVGGGSTFNCGINQGGAGALTITGANTFADITNTYGSTGATSILFPAATTTNFTNWNASGSAGNLLTISSSTAAIHTLRKTTGIVGVNYLSLSFSTATGGATWYAGANSTNGGNNSGWLFSDAPSTNSAKFLMLFQ